MNMHSSADYDGRRRSSASSRDTTVGSSSPPSPSVVAQRWSGAQGSCEGHAHRNKKAIHHLLGRACHSTPSSPHLLFAELEEGSERPRAMPANPSVTRARSACRNRSESPRGTPTVDDMEIMARLRIAESSDKILQIVAQFNKEHEELTRRFYKELVLPEPKRVVRHSRHLPAMHALFPWRWAAQDLGHTVLSHSLQGLAFASVMLVYFSLISTIPMANANGPSACLNGCSARRPHAGGNFPPAAPASPGKQASASSLADDKAERGEAYRQRRRGKLLSMFSSK